MRRPELTAFEQEALAVLEAVDAGTTSLACLTPGGWGASVVMRFCAAGWVLEVFDDCGWDYLETVTAPDGRRWRFLDGWDLTTEDESEALKDWSPEHPERFYEARVA